MIFKQDLFFITYNIYIFDFDQKENELLQCT